MASYIELAVNVYILVSIPSYQLLFSVDIKTRYYIVNIHPNNCHYLVFHILGIGQIQPICMLQGPRILFYIFGKFMNIILRLILSL